MGRISFFVCSFLGVWMVSGCNSPSPKARPVAGSVNEPNRDPQNRNEGNGGGQDTKTDKDKETKDEKKDQNPPEQQFTKKKIKSLTLASIVPIPPAEPKFSCFVQKDAEITITKAPTDRENSVGQVRISFEGAPTDCTLTEGYVAKSEWSGW